MPAGLLLLDLPQAFGDGSEVVADEHGLRPVAKALAANARPWLGRTNGASHPPKSNYSEPSTFLACNAAMPSWPAPGSVGKETVCACYWPINPSRTACQLSRSGAQI